MRTKKLENKESINLSSEGGVQKNKLDCFGERGATDLGKKMKRVVFENANFYSFGNTECLLRQEERKGSDGTDNVMRKESTKTEGVVCGLGIFGYGRGRFFMQGGIVTNWFCLKER